MIQAPTVEHVEAQLRRVWGDRLGVVVLHGWHATATIATHRYHRVTGAEILRAAILLDIGPESIELWDVKDFGDGVHEGGLELSLDLDPPTPIEKPTPHAEPRRGPLPAPIPLHDPKRRR